MAAVTAAPYKKLVKVGFSPRQAALLTATTPDWNRAWRRFTFGPRKWRLLSGGTTLTMANLLKAGFTRAQAKVILGL